MGLFLRSDSDDWSADSHNRRCGFALRVHCRVERLCYCRLSRCNGNFSARSDVAGIIHSFHDFLTDTFASKTAAIQDKWADSSIGNVTGSNAVNVFLGIGIAWAIASFVHFYRGTKFV